MGLEEPLKCLQYLDMDPVLSQLNPVLTLTSYFCKIQFNNIFLYMSKPPLFPSVFPTEMCNTCST